MSEGAIRFSATHCPSWDKMNHVLLSAYISQTGGLGSFSVSKEVTPAEAREYAASILTACEIVEKDQ